LAAAGFAAFTSFLDAGFFAGAGAAFAGAALAALTVLLAAGLALAAGFFAGFAALPAGFCLRLDSPFSVTMGGLPTCAPNMAGSSVTDGV
jgi:hypothetical protein